jgi:hypothetical protein
MFREALGDRACSHLSRSMGVKSQGLVHNMSAVPIRLFGKGNTQEQFLCLPCFS